MAPLSTFKLLLHAAARKKKKATLSRKKKKTRISTNHFSEELVLEILNKLPPKALCRFRCVCQTWRNLIGNPDCCDFRSKNPFNQTLRDPNPPPHLLVKAKPDSESLQHIFYFLSHDTLECQSKIALNVSDCFKHLMMVGASNGLLCLRSTDFIFLWNPATSEGLRSLPAAAFFPGVVGFGFDQRSNDYKVLNISYGENLRGRLVVDAEIFCLSTMTWRRLHVPVLLDRHNGYQFPTTASGGFFFWWAVRDGWKRTPQDDEVREYDAWISYCNENIVRFDFTEEVFCTTPVPYHARYMDFYSVNFTVFNGFVAIVGFPRENRCWAESNRCLTVWVLFEFGAKESWTKLVDIPLSLDFPERPLRFWRNWELLLQNAEGRMVLYDLLSHSKKDALPIHGETLITLDAVPDVPYGDQYFDLSDRDTESGLLHVFPHTWNTLVSLEEMDFNEGIFPENWRLDEVREDF